MPILSKPPQDGAINYNEARFPLVTIEFVGACSDEQFEEYLAKMRATTQRAEEQGKRYVIVVDTLQATRAVTAHQRKRQAEEMTENLRISRTAIAGMVFVINNPVVRGVLTAILWLQGMEWDYDVVRTRAEGDAWALQRVSGGFGQTGG